MVATADVFNAIQKNVTSHPKNLKLLLELWREDPDGVTHDVKKFLKTVILHEGDIPLKVRIFTFVSKFAGLCITRDKEDEKSDLEATLSFPPFSEEIILYFLDFINAKSKAIRWNICKFIETAMNEANEKAHIGVNLYEKLISKLLPRLRDKNASIRVHAVSSLSRLQNAEDMSDVVLEEFLRLLEFDTNKEVRKTVLSHLEITPITRVAILQKLHDVSPDVRLEAVNVVSRNMDLASFPRDQLLEFTKVVSEDKSRQVVKVVASMILEYVSLHGWFPYLSLYFEGCGDQVEETANIMQSVMEMVLPFYDCAKYVSDELSLSEGSVEQSGIVARMTRNSIKNDSLEVFLWRCISTRLVKVDPSILMEKLIPALSPLIDYLKGELISKEEPSEVDIQLATFKFRESMKLCALYDFSLDEIGRQRLTSFLKECLLSIRTIPDGIFSIVDMGDVQGVIIDLLGMLLEEENQLSLMIVEIASELSSFEEVVSAEKKTQSVIQSVFLVVKLLSKIKLRMSDTPVLQELKEQIIFPILRDREHLDSGVSLKLRIGTVKALSLYSMLDVSEATSSLVILFEIMKREEDAVKEVALQALFDVFTCYGTTLLKEPVLHKILQSDATTTSDRLADFFGENLLSQNSKMKKITIQGFCKLYLYGIISSATVLGALVILHFHPDTKDISGIRQFLSLFFPTFAFKSYSNMKILSSYSVQNMKVALTGSINFSELAEFYGNLTDTGNLEENPDDCEDLHSKIIEDISLLVLSDSKKGKKSDIIKHFPRIISHFVEITPETARRVRASIVMMQKCDVDATGKRALNKYLKMIDKMEIDFSKEEMEIADITERIASTKIEENVMRVENTVFEEKKRDTQVEERNIEKEDGKAPQIMKLEQEVISSPIKFETISSQVEDEPTTLPSPNILSSPHYNIQENTEPTRRVRKAKRIIDDVESDEEDALFETPDLVKSPFLVRDGGISKRSSSELRKRAVRMKILDSDTDDDYDDF